MNVRTKSDYGTVDNKTVLEPEDDAAHVNWGGAWRMPTLEEMDELENNCTCEWTTHGGKKGCRVTGSNGESIFLPAAGFYDDGSLYNAGFSGDYWSSSLYARYHGYACDLSFYFGSVNMGGCRRKNGQTVRPVCPSRN